MKRYFTIIALTVSLPLYIQAAIINVPGDIDSIQGGINLANTGDTVLVAPGTYVENIDFNGKKIVVGSWFLTTGNGSYISQTVIDGDSRGSVITFSNGEDSTTILIGFTITNGVGGCAEWFCWGGGITCGSNPTLSNLIITGNTSEIGGGINIASSNPKLSDVKIINNKAERGGGIYIGRARIGMGFGEDSNPKFDSVNRCSIFLNHATRGSDLYCDNDTLTIDVVVDTFTVLIPDSSYAYPVEKFTFDILNAAILTDMSGESSNLPNEFVLGQNYPNPFNPTTTIEFSLPQSGFVTLKIYNILGEEVATLVSEKLTAGKYKYDWDASILASGVYICRIKAGDYVESKKMVLLR